MDELMLSALIGIVVGTISAFISNKLIEKREEKNWLRDKQYKLFIDTCSYLSRYIDLFGKEDLNRNLLASGSNLAQKETLSLLIELKLLTNNQDLVNKIGRITQKVDLVISIYSLVENKPLDEETNQSVKDINALRDSIKSESLEAIRIMHGILVSENTLD
jgi:hypothetical protein